MQTVDQGKRLMQKGKMEDGVNEYTTDYTKPVKTKEIEPLKPIQHPRNIYAEDSLIVSHKIPPKNLTPYNQIPKEALAQINLLCKDSPFGAKSLKSCFLGAPNAGKSSLLNHLINKTVSAVSNKVNTTSEPTMGVFTDTLKKTQLIFTDTPGVTKASNSMRSSLLVTRAWDCIEENDQVIFVVDAAKRLSFEVKEALIRLNKRAQSMDVQSRRIMEAIQDDSFSEANLDKYLLSEEQKVQEGGLPCILVLNKVDLVTSKRKMRNLQAELDDLARFDHTFHTSCDTGFGIEALR